MDDDHNAIPREPPQEWIDALAEADADLAAGRTVPLEEVLDELRACLARMEAREAQASAKA
jgi:predicted transcriptional regulator